MNKKKFFKVYSGPGYPIDPVLELDRMNFIPLPEPSEDLISIMKKTGVYAIVNPNGLIPIIYIREGEVIDFST